jgi:hypothetical protein
MKTFLDGVAILVLTAFAAASPAAAQGPAGNGAAEAAGNGSSSRSYNPTRWFGKKDNKAAAKMPVDELDQKLEPKLRAAQVLAPDASLRDVCNNFVERVDCIAALRAAHSLALNFKCVRASMTGVRTDADASSCRMPADDKPLNLTKTIRLLKSDADAKSAAKEAETAAREDLKNAAS